MTYGPLKKDVWKMGFFRPEKWVLQNELVCQFY